MTILLKSDFIKRTLLESPERINQVYQYTKNDDEIFIRFIHEHAARFGPNYSPDSRPHSDPVGIYAYNVANQATKHVRKSYAYDANLGYVFKYPWHELERSGKCIVIRDRQIPDSILPVYQYLAKNAPVFLEHVFNLTKADIKIETARIQGLMWTDTGKQTLLDIYLNEIVKPGRWFDELTNYLGVTPAQITRSLMACGIDSLYDTGQGVINSAEPCQLLCVTDKYIKILDISVKKDKQRENKDHQAITMMVNTDLEFAKQRTFDELKRQVSGAYRVALDNPANGADWLMVWLRAEYASRTTGHSDFRINKILPKPVLDGLVKMLARLTINDKETQNLYTLRQECDELLRKCNYKTEWLDSIHPELKDIIEQAGPRSYIISEPPGPPKKKVSKASKEINHEFPDGFDIAGEIDKL